MVTLSRMMIRLAALMLVCTAGLFGCAVSDTEGNYESTGYQRGGAVVIVPDSIVTEKGELKGRAVLVKSGKIARIVTAANARKLANQHRAALVLAPDHVLSPGFINAYDQLSYDHRGPLKILTCPKAEYGDKDPRQRYDQRQDWFSGCRRFTRLHFQQDRDTETLAFNELRHLAGGTTSIAGPDGVPGFVRNFGTGNDALREGLKSRRVIVDAFPLGDTGCKHQMGSGDNYPAHPDKAGMKGAVYIAPVAAGLDRQARNEYLNLSSDKGRRVNMLGRHTGFVHLMALLPQDVKAFAQSGSTLVWAPLSSISLYGDTAHVTLHKRHGTNIALATDWAYSGSTSLLGELAVVYAFNEKLPGKAAFSDREIWRMVTVNPARLLDVSRQLGDIRAGMVADLALFRKRENVSYRNGYHVVITAGLEEVDMVMRDGIPLYGNAGVLHAVLDAWWSNIPEDRKIQGKVIDTLRETTDPLYGELRRYASLAHANRIHEPLTGEKATPCRVPVRGIDKETGKSLYYNKLPLYPLYDANCGGRQLNDCDRDGMYRGTDNDDGVFNPLRPVDMTARRGRQVKVW